MNKIEVAAITSATTFFGLASAVLAKHEPGHIELSRPALNQPGGSPRAVGFANLGDAINNIIVLAFIIAIILVLVMLVWGALEWIMSGGEKDSVGKARSKILNALIGLAVLAVAWAIYMVAGQFVGINPRDFTIPGPP